jgi:hypothetical protein
MISGKKIYGIVTTEYLDIDNKEDLEKVKKEKKFFRNFKKELLRI